MTLPDPSAAQPAIDLEIPTGVQPEEVAPKKRQAPLFIAIGVVVALLLGVGAYAGYQFLTGGVQPAAHLPASIVAYAGVDLKPGLDQQKKLQTLVRKFPDLGTKAENSEQVVADLLKKLKLDDIDAQKDLAPWVGVRAGLALWMHNNEPYLLLSVASRDDKAAVDGLTRIAAKVTDASAAFIVKDGVALIAGGKAKAQDAVKAAEQEAAKGSFADSERFADARKWLGDDHVLNFWFDMGRVPDLLKLAALSAKEYDEVLKTLEKTGAELKGTFAFGIRATDYGIEGRYRSFGMKSTETKTVSDALAKLGAQPADAQVALLLQIPEIKDEATLKALEEMGAPQGNDPKGGKLTAAEEAELDALMMKEETTEAEDERLFELFSKSGMSGGGNPFAGMAEMVGALSGATLTGSGGGLDTTPGFQLVLQVASAAEAEKLAGLEELIAMASEDAEFKTEGSTITLGTKGYTAGGKKLADEADFRTATADAPANVQVAIYANVAKLYAKAKPVRAVGFVSGTDNGDAVGSFRILID